MLNKNECLSNILVKMLSKLYCHQNRTQLELLKLVKVEFCVSELGAQLVNCIHVMIRFIYLFLLLCLAVFGEIMAWEEE